MSRVQNLSGAEVEVFFSRALAVVASGEKIKGVKCQIVTDDFVELKVNSKAYTINKQTLVIKDFPPLPMLPLVIDPDMEVSGSVVIRGKLNSAQIKFKLKRKRLTLYRNGRINITNKKEKCQLCGILSDNSWQYRKTTWGPLVICNNCRAKHEAKNAYFNVVPGSYGG